MKLAYIRVSTVEQNLERQYENLKNYGIEKYFEEKVSGSTINRPKLKEMMEWARAGDTVYIDEFSRLARNTRDLLDIVETLTQRGVQVISHKEKVDFSTPQGKLFLTLIASLAEFELELRKERQREGIAIAKAAGKYKGRAAKQVADIGTHYQRYMSRETSKPKIAAELGISRPTLDRLFTEYLADLEKA